MVKAVTVSSTIFTVAMLFADKSFPRSVLVSTGCCASGSPAACGSLPDLMLERRPTLAGEPVKRQRTLVVGAGDVAEALLREIGRGSLPYKVLGLVTDDPVLRGRRLHGIGVVGGVDDIPALCERQGIDVVLIASVNGSAGDRRSIAQRCRDAGVELGPPGPSRSAPRTRGHRSASERSTTKKPPRPRGDRNERRATDQRVVGQACSRYRCRRIDRLGARSSDRRLRARGARAVRPRGERSVRHLCRAS